MLTRASWLVAAATALAVSYAGFDAWARHPVAFDDAYISYRYADNLVAGNGLVYNVGERVQGYTNFLWTLIAAAAIQAGLDPFGATASLGVACHLAVLAMLAALATTVWLRQGAFGLLLLPALGALVLPEGYAGVAGSGLESSFVGLLLTTTGVVLYAGDPGRRATRGLLSLLLSCACLTRLDALVATAAVGVAVVLDQRQRGAGVRDGLRAAAEIGLPVAVVAGAYLVFTYAYYGAVLPNTYHAKAADLPHVREGFQYLGMFVRSEPQAVPLFLAGATTIFGGGDPRRRRLAVFATLSVLADVLHIVRVGGDFMEYRFMWQLYGLLSLGGFLGLATLLSQSRAAALSLALTIFAASFQPTQLEKVYGMQSLDEMDDYARTGVEIGERLGEVLPRETVLATTLAGTMAYFSKRAVIDQWGLNDAFVARVKFEHRTLPRGHVKFAPLDYLQRRKVNLYIAHPVVCSCSRPCREDKPNVFIRLSKNRCLRSWYLVQDPKQTAHFCAHPEHFLLNKVDCGK